MKGLDKAEELKELYERVASQYDPDGFRLYFAAQEIVGILMMVVSASTTPPWRSPAIPISPASSPMRTTAVSLMRRTVINC